MENGNLEVLYKNTFSEFNILVTQTKIGRVGAIENKDIYKAHIWIHDKKVLKNHSTYDMFSLGDTVGEKELIRFFGDVKFKK